MIKLSRYICYLVIASTMLIGGTVSAKPYKGGEIYSQQSYQYGRYEMRMRAAKGSGVLSTFFTYKNGSELQGEFWEEIDIEIFGKNNATQWQSNIIIGTSRPTIKTEAVHNAGVSLADDYHTYVLEWTPSYVAWFVDGVQVRRVNGGQFVDGVSNPQSIRFNLWAANIPEWVGAWNDSILPVYQFINYLEYKPYIAATNSFGDGWRDDFNSFDSNRWGRADWTFNENLVDFAPANVVVRNGILILALTREGQTGYNGTPPADNGGGVNSSSSSSIRNSVSSSSVANVSSASSSANNTGGGTCNWYGSPLPLCVNVQNGWGWEQNRSCVGRVTCSSQTGGGGIVGESSSSAASTASSTPNNSGGTQCDWYGSLYPLCVTTQSGWGWEQSRSCISRSTCSSQNGSGGIR